MEMLVACPGCGWLGGRGAPVDELSAECWGPTVDGMPGYLPLQHLPCVIKERMSC